MRVIAPEVMCRQNHGIAVDYYAVGVIGYECMFGKVIKAIVSLFNIASLFRQKQKGNQRLNTR